MVPVNFSYKDCADASEYYQRIGPQTPPTAGRVAGLMLRLLNYGTEILIALRLRAATPAIEHIGWAFRTTDIFRVLSILSLALNRCRVLEDTLMMEAGIGVQAALLRYRALHPRAPRAAKPADPPDAAGAPADATPDPRAAATPDSCTAATGRRREPRRAEDGPTTAQIEADIRRRGAGAVIADICRDLGITSKHPLWPELAAAIIAFGGSTAALEEDATEGTRWCSKTWMDLPYPKPDPTNDYQASYMRWVDNGYPGASAGLVQRQPEAVATGPP
jgi:hypothetical protein